MDAVAELADWGPFLSAEVGAAATLTGLLFVGVSLNLSKILSLPYLPYRAMLALLILLANLFVASFLLMPRQSATAIGLEVLAVCLLLWGAGSLVEWIGWRRRTTQNPVTLAVNIAIFQIAVLTLLAGGILLLVDDPAGFYWIGTGILLCFFKAVVDAWVLLVEINR